MPFCEIRHAVAANKTLGIDRLPLLLNDRIERAPPILVGIFHHQIDEYRHPKAAWLCVFARMSAGSWSRGPRSQQAVSRLKLLIYVGRVLDRPS